jgi:four helix bundle protein
MKSYKGYKDLIVYQKAIKLSMIIHKITQSYPVEEKYSLTDQIRRSSRSIGANIAESWPKRIYPKSFVAKLIDAQAEASETNHWIDVSLTHSYINKAHHAQISNIIEEILKMLDSMIMKPEKFIRKRNL